MEQDKKCVQEEELNVELDGVNLSLKFTNLTDSIKITLIEGNTNYENKYTLEDLRNINAIFKAMETIEKVYKHFISIIRGKKYDIKKVNENEFDLVLKIIIISDIVDIPLQLYKSK